MGKKVCKIQQSERVRKTSAVYLSIPVSLIRIKSTISPIFLLCFTNIHFKHVSLTAALNLSVQLNRLHLPINIFLWGHSIGHFLCVYWVDGVKRQLYDETMNRRVLIHCKYSLQDLKKNQQYQPSDYIRKEKGQKSRRGESRICYCLRPVSLTSSSVAVSGSLMWFALIPIQVRERDSVSERFMIKMISVY